LLLNDLRFAIRFYGKRPGFLLIVVFIMGLGIGVTSAGDAVEVCCATFVTRCSPRHFGAATPKAAFGGANRGEIGSS
jgi:hypothetical protein